MARRGAFVVWMAVVAVVAVDHDGASGGFFSLCTSASPRAARHKAADGLMGEKPAPHFDSSASPAGPPMSTPPAIMTAAKPTA
jgi:hypothetical protein